MVITRGRRRSHLVLPLLLLLVLVCHVGFGSASKSGRRSEEEEKVWMREMTPSSSSTSSYDEDHDDDDGGDESRFMLRRFSKPFMKTEAGEMRVLENYGGRFTDKPLHIGFITMEPKSLFIPQYFDSTLIIFIRRGIHTLYFFKLF